MAKCSSILPSSLLVHYLSLVSKGRVFLPRSHQSALVGRVLTARALPPKPDWRVSPPISSIHDVRFAFPC